MEQYVLGFLFSLDATKVALIAKQKPQWQKGLWNGIGGKMEALDGSFQFSMTREFREETGVEIDYWDYCMVHNYSNCYLHIFRAFSTKINDIKKQDDEVEIPQVFNLSELPENVIPNLNWIIPMLTDESIEFPYAVSIKGK